MNEASSVARRVKGLVSIVDIPVFEKVEPGGVGGRRQEERTYNAPLKYFFELPAFRSKTKRFKQETQEEEGWRNVGCLFRRTRGCMRVDTSFA